MEVVIFGKLIFLIADMSLYQVYAVVGGQPLFEEMWADHVLLSSSSAYEWKQIWRMYHNW